VPPPTPAPPPPLTFAERYRGSIQAGANTHFLGAAGYVTVPGARERLRVQIGNDSLIDCQFIFESDEGEITVGDRCFINGGTRLISRRGIHIGDDVVISWSCLLYDHGAHSLNWRHRQDDMRRQLENVNRGDDLRANKDWSTVAAAPIIIQDKVWLGFETVVFKGVTIGEGAVVGARSVVTHDVPPWTVVAGSPARFVAEIPESDR
jgi:acetyltransferase-like isoleucine patch superfamily enzyme